MTVLTDAKNLVDHDRGDAYGHPTVDFGRVSDAALALDIDPAVGPLHHALYMILVKMSRLVQTPTHYDSLVDIAGYAYTYEKILDERAEHDPDYPRSLNVRQS